MATTDAGYSGTPLPKKLGIAAGMNVLLLDAPAGYRGALAPLPEGVRFATRASASVDLVQAFVLTQAKLGARLASVRRSLRPEVPLWISWPKKASKVPTDVTEDAIRALALPLGWVDIKVCAVDATWSGLKLVVRKTLR